MLIMWSACLAQKSLLKICEATVSVWHGPNSAVADAGSSEQATRQCTIGTAALYPVL